MLDIDCELKILLTRLAELRLPCALCGGLAMAVHGHPRATFDIDLVALGGSASAIAQAARALGFTLNAAPMKLAGGRVEITRVSKASPAADDDVLPLDILALDSAIENEMRFEETEWEGIPLRVVDRASLIRLKQLRDSAQDRADIEKIRS